MNEPNQDQKILIPLRAYTLKELGHLYEVDWRTFKKWTEPFQDEIGIKRGRYYTIPQVRIIFDKLGLPSMLEA